MNTPNVRGFTAFRPLNTRILATSIIIGKHFVDPEMMKERNAHKYIALWDTGATTTAISPKVVEECGLLRINKRSVSTANSTRISEVYLASVRIEGTVGFSAIQVTEADLSGPVDVLIGMDIIGAGDFTISNGGDRLRFCYQFPSVLDLDLEKLTYGK